MAPLLTWLLPLAPLWACGIVVLFRTLVPNMLMSTEKALGAQRDRDHRHNTTRNTRMSVREWDELDQQDSAGQCGPCCQCGVWSEAVRQVFIALSLAMALGFVMMVSLQLEIGFLGTCMLLRPLSCVLCIGMGCGMMLREYLCSLICRNGSCAQHRAVSATWTQRILLECAPLFILFRNVQFLFCLCRVWAWALFLCVWVCVLVCECDRFIMSSKQNFEKSCT